jgi:hypothetical protein
MDGVKCGHEACTCFVDLGERYCSAACREDVTADTDVRPRGPCRCRHAECEAR